MIIVLVILLISYVVVLKAIRCEEPSLPANQFHILIAGHKSQVVNETNEYHYILQHGLTNSKVFVYRREHPERVRNIYESHCGISVEEKILLPNRGREGTAFYDYVV